MKPDRRPLSLAVALVALAGAAHGQVITVTTTANVSDFGGAQQVADLPGPDGAVSFREACTAANNTAGPQTIAFAIPAGPPNEWSGGVAILSMGSSPFVLSDDATTVDFTTQAAFAGDTNPAGNEVGVRAAPITGAPAIHVSGNGCTIKGLDRVSWCGYGVQLAGNGNRVIGCTISGALYAGVYITGGFGGPPARDNVVGGTLPGEGNTLSSGNDGVRIDAPADDNVVVGNVLTGTFHGAAVRGSVYSTFPNGNRIGGPTAAERNLIAGAGKYGEEGFPDGAQVSIEHANGTLVEGNHIGTTADGTAPAAVQRGPVGVNVIDSTNTVVRGNVIGGIRVAGVNHYAGQVFGDGVRVTTINGPTARTTIEDNRIGTDPSGQSPVPNLYGVRVVPFVASHPTTGTVVSGNTIASNERAGLVVASSVSGVLIGGNAFADNGQLGIDLLGPGGGSGVTPNDALDADAGGNGLQNFPVLQSAADEGGSVRVAGSLGSTPSSGFTIEFFASPGCDASGFGEGQLLLGSAAVVTDAGGVATFDVTLPASVTPGWTVTATATSAATSSTSEFSACVAVTGVQTPWADLGFALAGTNGDPVLAGVGTLVGGDPLTVSLGNARESAPVFLIVGFSELYFWPFYGGTLVPDVDPPGLIVIVFTDGAGETSLGATWPLGIPAGFELFLQAWIDDPAAPFGYAASNAIQGTTP